MIPKQKTEQTMNYRVRTREEEPELMQRITEDQERAEAEARKIWPERFA